MQGNLGIAVNTFYCKLSIHLLVLLSKNCTIKCLVISFIVFPLYIVREHTVNLLTVFSSSVFYKILQFK